MKYSQPNKMNNGGPFELVHWGELHVMTNPFKSKELKTTKKIIDNHNDVDMQ